jgi:ribosomal protein L39E
MIQINLEKLNKVHKKIIKKKNTVRKYIKYRNYRRNQLKIIRNTKN